MNKLRVVLLFNLTFAISNLNAAPDTNENIIIANVWINGVDKTTEALYLDQNGVHYVECNVFAMLNIKKELFKTNPTKPEFCIVSEAPVSSEFDEKMNQYLQPSTLFGQKFDQYLNQKKMKESANEYEFLGF